MRALVRQAMFGAMGASLLWLAPAQATTIRARTTEQAFKDSMVVATVIVRAVKAEQAGGRIVTRAQLEVSEAFKGAANGSTVEVVIPGGQVGEWVQKVEGAPKLEVGERCIVFLEPAGQGRFLFSGLEQGKFHVDEDASNPLGGVVRRTTTARLVQPSADGSLRDVAAPAATEPLKPFLESLRQLSRGAR